MSLVADQVIVIAGIDILQRRDQVAEIRFHPSHPAWRECYCIEGNFHIAMPWDIIKKIRCELWSIEFFTCSNICRRPGRRPRGARQGATHSEEEPLPDQLEQPTALTQLDCHPNTVGRFRTLSGFFQMDHPSQDLQGGQTVKLMEYPFLRTPFFSTFQAPSDVRVGRVGMVNDHCMIVRDFEALCLAAA